MSAWRTPATITVAMLVVAAPGFAQTATERPDGWRQSMSLLQALDADGDGQISAAEIAAASDSLSGLDVNADGAISADELMPQQGGRLRRAFMGGAVAGREFGAVVRFGPGRALARGHGFAGARRFGPFGRHRFASGGLWTSRPELGGGRHWSGGFQGGFGRGGGGAVDQRGRGIMRQRMLDGLFSRFDADGDGYLSSEGMPETLWERLSSADADGNGQLTREELEAHQESMSGSGRGRFRQRNEARPEASQSQ